MRPRLPALFCLLLLSSPAQTATPIRILDPVPYAPGNDVPARIRNECTRLGHEIAFMLHGLMRGKVQLVQELTGWDEKVIASK